MTVIDVTEDTYEDEVENAGKPVLIDFWAVWCGPCKMLSPTLEVMANEREDIKVVKVDADTQTSLTARFGVVSIPTMILMDGSNRLMTIVGAMPRRYIESELEKVL